MVRWSEVIVFLIPLFPDPLVGGGAAGHRGEGSCASTRHKTRVAAQPLEFIAFPEIGTRVVVRFVIQPAHSPFLQTISLAERHLPPACLYESRSQHSTTVDGPAGSCARD